MSSATESTLRPAGEIRTCAICQTPVSKAEPRVRCPGCAAVYHADCWSDNGGCGVYGCSKVPPTEKLADIEVPVSYWGQEDKPCPVCQKTILAAAVRCRYCGATFESARPQESAEFSREASRKQREPGLRAGSIWLLITCLIPILAPFGAVFGGLWYRRNREDLARLPGTYRALCLIGLTVAAGQMLLFALLMLILSVSGGT